MKEQLGYKMVSDELTGIGGYKYNLDSENIYTGSDELEVGFRGLHYCAIPLACYINCDNYDNSMKLFKIKVKGNIKKNKDAYVTDKFEFVEEIKNIPEFMHEYITKDVEKGYDSILYNNSTLYWCLVSRQVLYRETLFLILDNAKSLLNVRVSGSNIMAQDRESEKLLELINLVREATGGITTNKFLAEMYNMHVYKRAPLVVG